MKARSLDEFTKFVEGEIEPVIAEIAKLAEKSRKHL